MRNFFITLVLVLLAAYANAQIVVDPLNNDPAPGGGGGTFEGGVIDFTLQQSTNNYQWLEQRNAANSAYYNLMHLDSADDIVIGESSVNDTRVLSSLSIDGADTGLSFENIGAPLAQTTPKKLWYVDSTPLDANAGEFIFSYSYIDQAPSANRLFYNMGYNAKSHSGAFDNTKDALSVFQLEMDVNSNSHVITLGAYRSSAGVNTSGFMNYTINKDVSFDTVRFTTNRVTFMNPTQSTTYLDIFGNTIYVGSGAEFLKQANNDDWIKQYDSSNSFQSLIYLDSTDSTLIGDPDTNLKFYAESTALTDGSISNTQVNPWIDETNDELVFKLKDSGGTVQNATIPLDETINTTADTRLDTATSLPTCDSATEGQITYVHGTSNPTGQTYLCRNNHGFYELVPFGGIGMYSDLWVEQDFGGQSDHGSLCLVGNGGVAVAPEVEIPGVYQATTDGTLNNFSGANLALCSSTTQLVLLGTGWIVEGSIRVDQTTNQVFGFGAFSDTDDINDTYMAFFEHDSTRDGNIHCITRDGTGEAGQTITDTGLAISTSNWYHYLIVRNSSDIEFYVSVNDGDFVLECTHTTDLPGPTAADLVNATYITASAAETKSYDVDYLRQSKLGLDR